MKIPRHSNELPHEYMRPLTQVELDAERWRWLRMQQGWPDSESAASGESPEWFDRLADEGIKSNG